MEETEKILLDLEIIKKEVQDIRSILEPKRFIPEDSNGPCTMKKQGCFDVMRQYSTLITEWKGGGGDGEKRKNNIPTIPYKLGQLECGTCKLLEKAQAENKQLQWECDTILKVMEFLLSATELWAKSNGFIPLASKLEEDIKKELSDGKNEVRALFNDLIKTGEPAFLDRLFRGLDLPEDFQHFI